MVKGLYWAYGKRSGAKFLVDVADDDAPIGTVLKRSGPASARGSAGSAVRLRGLRGFVRIPGPVTMSAMRDCYAAQASASAANKPVPKGASA